MITVSSGSITIHAVISRAGVEARTGFRTRVPASRRRRRHWPGTSGGRSARRGSLRAHLADAPARGGVDRRADALVGPAPADIGDGGVDLRVARAWLVLEKGGHRHHHSALAIAALRNIEVEPRLLHGMKRAVRSQALDGGDLLVSDGAHR